MAQYRAIFQNAYFKGLATAAVLTAGLAAGQAQAASNAFTGATPPTSGDTVFIDGTTSSESTHTKFDAITITEDKNLGNLNIEISKGAIADNTVKTGAQKAATLTINNLTIQGADENVGLSLVGVSGSGDATLKANTINIVTGTLQTVFAKDKVGHVQASSITLGDEGIDPNKAVLDIGSTSIIGNSIVADSSKNTSITLNEGALVKVESGDGLGAGEIKAGTLTINSGELQAVGKADGTNVAKLNITLVDGSMNGGKITTASGDALSIAFTDEDVKNNGQSVDKVFSLSSGEVVAKGDITLTGKGAFTLADPEQLKITSESGKEANFVVSGADAQKATTLSLSKAALDNLAAKTKIDTKNAVLDITGNDQITLGGSSSDLTFINTATVGKIKAQDDTTLKAVNVKVDGTVTNAGSVTVDATNLTLGTATYSGGATGDKNFNAITAQSLAVGSNGAFNVGDTITLTSINEKSTDADKATVGTITGDFDLKAATGDLTVKGGKYNTNSNFTLTSGDLSVVNSGTNTSELTLTGNVVFNTAAQTNGSLIASGNAAGDVDLVVLDASDATLSYNDDGSNAQGNATLTIDKATMKVNGENLSELFERTTTSGAIATVDNGGKLVVTGDLELNADQIANNGIPKAKSGINLTSGSLSVADTLIVNKVAETTGFSLGASAADNATVKANTLQTVMATGAKDKVSVLKSGTFIVTNGLVTDSTKGFELGEQATLQLGDFKKVSNTVSTSETTNGTANYALTLNHADANLNVVAGDWTAKGLTVTSGTLTVGNDGSKLDANGNALKSSLSVDKLVASDASNAVNVTKQGTLNTKDITVDTGSITVNGNMSIDGKHTAAEGTNQESFGISLKDNAITLKEGATLTLGADANHALGLADATGVVSAVTVKGGFNASGSLVGENFSTVKLTLGKDVSFDADGLTSLKTALFGDTGTQGTISLGDAKIDLAYKGTADEPILEWKDVTADQKLVLPSFSDEKTKITTIKLTDTGPIRGHFGSVAATGVASTQQIVVDNNGSLNSADVVSGSANKLFAYNEKGEVLGLSVNDKFNFALVNGGEAGKVTLGTDSSLLVDGGQANGKTVLAELTGKKSAKVTIAGDLDVKGKLDLNKVESKEGTTLTVAKDATLAGDSTLAGNTVVAGTLTAEKAFTSTGSLQVSGTSTFAGETKLSGNNTLLGDVAFNGKTTLEGQNTLGATTFQVSSSVAQGQTFAKEIKLSGNAVELSVGQDAVVNTLPNGSTATLVADKLTLAGGTLFADPTFNLPRTIVVAGELTDLATADKDTDAGTLDGKAVALRNSIIALGVDTKDANGKDAYQAAVDYVENTFAPLFEADQSLQSDGIGAIAYVNKKLTMGTNSKIVVDPSHGIDGYKNANAAYKAKIDDNEIYLGTGAALAVDANALNNGAAISFDKATNASVYAEEKAKVLVVGNGIQNKNLVLFENTNAAQNAGVILNGNDLAVESINGLFKGKFTVGQSMEGEVELELDRAAANKYLSSVSAPVQDTLLAAAYGMHNYEEYEAAKKNGTLAKFQEDSVLGNVAEGFKVVKDKNTQNYEVYYGDQVATAEQLKEFNIDKETSIELAKKNTTATENVVYANTKNDLLDNILYYDGNAIDAETNARLAVFGGAPQAAIEAGASTYEAISARMGVGVSGVSAAANGQGGAIWVTPVYKSADADGFAADNKSYGADVKLYGLALGADIEVAPNFKVGGMFNVGSGDADGQGLGSNVSNDFDYYGLGLYAGYSMDAFSLVADVTYTAVDNDIEGNTDLGKVNASIDSTNLSVGVTGQYKLSLAGMDVTPHAGLRYSMIDMDDYSTAYSQNDSDSLNIFSVPVGVTIAKEYVTDTWTVKPSFDLTLTGNFGDDEAESTAKWNGFSNLSTTVKSEIMDNFTYGAAVGVSATSGNFGLGLGVNYTGSSNTDEFGVNANARYMF